VFIKSQLFNSDVGEPGQVGINYVLRADGEREMLDGTAQVVVGIDDVLVIETPGGGGYGC